MSFIYISKKDDEKICSAVVMQGTPPEFEHAPYIDAQGDWIKMKTLVEGAHEMFEKNERICFDVDHSGGRCHLFPVIENVVLEKDMVRHGTLCKKGAWIMTIKITDDRIWQQIKGGKLNGFSPLGVAEA